MFRYKVYLHEKRYVSFLNVTRYCLLNVKLHWIKFLIIFYINIFFKKDIKKCRSILNMIYKSKDAHVAHYVRFLREDAQKGLIRAPMN